MKQRQNISKKWTKETDEGVRRRDLTSITELGERILTSQDESSTKCGHCYYGVGVWWRGVLFLFERC